jgi:hypothetical protein
VRAAGKVKQKKIHRKKFEKNSEGKNSKKNHSSGSRRRSRRLLHVLHLLQADVAPGGRAGS